MVIFAGIIALRLEKVGPAFSSFNTRPSLSFVARQQGKLINIVLHNKTGLFFFGIQLMQKHVLAFNNLVSK